MKKIMHKNKVILACVVVGVVLAGGVYLYSTNDKKQYSANAPSNIKQASMLFIENFVNEGIELYTQKGIDALVGDEYTAYITGSGGTYLFIIDKAQDLIIFNPGSPHLVGTKASAIQDSSDTKIVKDIIYKKANADGVWVKYKFIDPFDLQEKEKDTFVKLVNGDLIFGAGIYVRDRN